MTPPCLSSSTASIRRSTSLGLIAALATFALSIASPSAAFANDPGTLCQRAPRTERRMCTSALKGINEALDPIAWSAFSTCFMAPPMLTPKSVGECLTPEMRASIKTHESGTRRWAAGYGSSSVEDICARASDSLGDDPEKCTRDLKELKNMLGEAVWAEFTTCLGAHPTIEKEQAFECLKPHMDTLMNKSTDEELKKENKAEER